MVEELEKITQKTNIQIKKALHGTYETLKSVEPKLSELYSKDNCDCDGSDGGCTGCYCDDSDYIKNN